jgi:SAM-dependent methyltransferase
MIDPVTLAGSIDTFKARANTSRRAPPRSTLDVVTVPESPSSSSPVGTAVTGSAYWDRVSEGIAGRYYHDVIVGGLKREVHLTLIRRWCGDLAGARVLKTDLFEEAHGPDQFLFDLAPSRLRLGIDISPLIARRAAERALAGAGPPPRCLAADVLALPFRAEAFDVIVSNSTLDHFPDPRLIDAAFGELYRVLKPGGVLVVTLDNPYSLSRRVGAFKRVLRPDPFFLGRTLSRRQLVASLRRTGYEVHDTTAIFHGLENHLSAAMEAAQRVGGLRLCRAIGAGLRHLEKLEAVPTRYLTGAFVAARAVKPLPARGH